MAVPIVQVDAFTATPFRGNPAAVCLLPTPADPRWMQDVASEMNLSETAFLHPMPDGLGLRWFTPAAEVDLCGHATLASAHVLWEEGRLGPTAAARFHTKSGLLTARKAAAAGWIELDFPATPAEPAAAPPALATALGVQPCAAGRTRFDYLIEVDSEDAVRRLAPDFAAIGRLGARGVIVTSRASTDGYDFVSRFFAPGLGIAEDPVTGRAHCALAPWWAAKLGKTEMTGFQASARGGLVRVRVAGERVVLAGQAVTVLRGELAERT
ncbi:MAG: PhzF family phenazine biosynthesis protein [Gemmatimonadales bacterium]